MEKFIYVLLGLAIGLLGTGVVAILAIQEQMKWLSEYHKFFKEYAKLQDEALENLTTSVQEKLDKLYGINQKLLEIDKNLSKDNVNFEKQVLNLVKNDHENNMQLVTGIQDAFGNYMTIEDERWNLICDYITNKEPEFSNGEPEVDLEAEGLI